MRTYGIPTADAPVLLFAHGAGAGETHPWMVHTATRLAAAGISVVTFNFDYMDAGRRLPDRGPALEERFAAEWIRLHETAGVSQARAFVGGKSMGGRMATQAAARGLFHPAPAGIVCFGYPLHPPAQPDKRRDAHLASIDLPLLFAHGTRDGFGTPDEMKAVASRLPTSTLILAEGGDHSLQAQKRSDPTGRVLDDAIAQAADWIHAVTVRRA